VRFFGIPGPRDSAYFFIGDALIPIRPPIARAVFENGALLGADDLKSFHASLNFKNGVGTVRFSTNAAEYRIQTRIAMSHFVLQRITLQTNGSKIRFLLPASAQGTVKLNSILLLINGKPEQPDLHSVDDGVMLDLPQAGQCELMTCVSVGSQSGHADFDALWKQADRDWESKWKTDIVIQGPAEDQRAVRSFLFNLYQSAPAVMPPMAASSGLYRGHRFWDAEAWMLPVYALIDSAAAKRSTAWRIRNTHNGFVPWEAGPNGQDCTDKNFRRALHQVGWVSWWLQKAAALGLAAESDCLILQRQLAKQVETRAAVQNNVVHFLKVESPDEGEERDDDLTTNLLAARLLENYSDNLGIKLRAGKLKIAIPRAQDGLPATYNHDSIRTYTQTAALLALYPLEYRFDNATAEKMFDRYKNLTEASGPAMSDSIHAVIAARLGRKQEAYEFWQRSWRRFLDPDSMVFNERAARPSGYFATGAAGCLQTVLYGFLGIRISNDQGKIGTASKPLLGGWRLDAKPNLPSGWSSITFKGLQLFDGRYTIHATHSSVTITKGG